ARRRTEGRVFVHEPRGLHRAVPRRGGRGECDARLCAAKNPDGRDTALSRGDLPDGICDLSDTGFRDRIARRDPRHGTRTDGAGAAAGDAEEFPAVPSRLFYLVAGGGKRRGGGARDLRAVHAAATAGGAARLAAPRDPVGTGRGAGGRGSGAARAVFRDRGGGAGLRRVADRLLA